MSTSFYRNLNGIKELLRNDWEGKRGIKSKNQDRVVVITGDEGIGKSNLLLWMHEIWNKDILGDTFDESNVFEIGDNKKNFVKALKGSKKYAMVSHDEAGKDLYMRDSMSGFNKDLNKAYIVIRASKKYTILVIPSILDLDSFFRKRRVRTLIHVYDFGKCAVFMKKQLRYLVPKLAYKARIDDDPNPLRLGIAPLFYDTFPMYPENELMKAYQERKEKNMQEVIEYLNDKYVEENGGKTGKLKTEIKQLKGQLAKNLNYEDWNNIMQMSKVTWFAHKKYLEDN